MLDFSEYTNDTNNYAFKIRDSIFIEGNENSIVTINCPNANDSRGIWYIEQDQDPQFTNYIDIVMEK